MPDNHNFDSKQQHSFGAGRIRRAGQAGPNGPEQSGQQVFGWEGEASVPHSAQPAQAAPTRPGALPKDGRANLFGGEGATPGNLFGYDGTAAPPPPAPGRQSLFDYDAGEHLPPRQPSPGYSEHYLAGGPQQAPPPGTVFDFDQDYSATPVQNRPRQPSRMREQYVDLQAPARTRGPVEDAPEPARPRPQREEVWASSRAQSRRAETPPRRPATVFDALAGEDAARPPRHADWQDGQAPAEAWAQYEGAPPRGKKGRAVQAAQNGGQGGGKPRRKRRWPVVLAVLVLLLGVAGVLANHYLGNLLDPGAFGRILPNPDVPPSPYSKKDVLHLLIVGIDYEEGRQYAGGLGLTDMILYCRYDIKNNKMNMLQIPRDSYVGESLPTGGTGKINALLISGEDKNNPINNLAGPLQSMLQLPVDNYIAMDMDALKTIVDTFGGIQVYVPREMNYDGSYLAQGWQTLDGNAAEFFVRARKGAGFERGDIDRLDNQRHFYSALFRRLLNMTPGDVANLFPVFDHYCNTDLSLSDMIGLGVAALNLKAEEVLFAKVPGATDTALDPTGAGRSMYFVDRFGRPTAEGEEEAPGLAKLLNDYFRGEEGQAVSAEELQWPDVNLDGYALYPPNVQGMAEVQTPEGGADVDVEPKA